jgi:hypothetical protein
MSVAMATATAVRASETHTATSHGLPLRRRCVIHLYFSPHHMLPRPVQLAAVRRRPRPQRGAIRASRNPLGHGLPHRRSRVIHLLLFTPRRESLSRHDMLPRPVQPASRRTAPSFSVPARGFDQFGGGYPGAGAPLRSHRPRRAAAASNPAYADMATSRRTRRQPPINHRAGIIRPRSPRAPVSITEAK